MSGYDFTAKLVQSYYVSGDPEVDYTNNEDGTHVLIYGAEMMAISSSFDETGATRWEWSEYIADPEGQLFEGVRWALQRGAATTLLPEFMHALREFTVHA